MDKLKDLQQGEQELIQAEERLRKSNERRELVNQKLRGTVDLNKKVAMHKRCHDRLLSETKDLAYDALLERIRQLEESTMVDESGKSSSAHVQEEREKPFKQLRETWATEKESLQQQVESLTQVMHGLKLDALEYQGQIDKLKAEAAAAGEHRRLREQELSELKQNLEQERKQREALQRDLDAADSRSECMKTELEEAKAELKAANEA